jgi:hypothetical protein
MKAIHKVLIIAMVALSLPSFAQTKIGDVILPNTLKSAGTQLSLNGGGIREKMWIDLYVVGLYVKTKSTDGTAIMNADEPMIIHLEIVSGMITSEKMINACNEGFEKATGENTAPIQPQIDAFIEAFMDPIAEGDSYDLAYSPKEGTKIYKNGKVVKTIEGLAFKKALFGIWLCDDPADSGLKTDMLGS